MKLTYTYIFKLFLITFFVWLSTINIAFCQEGEPAENQEGEPADNSVQDSIAIAYRKNPFGIQLGIDLLKLGSFALDTETKYEGQLGLSFKQVTLIAEAGYAYYASALAYKNSDNYEVEGKYYRIGIDYAFNIGIKSQLLLGLRYGISDDFGHSGTFEVSSELWEHYITSIPSAQKTGASATWGEAILGSQSNIAKNLHFGWYFRLRKMFERTSYTPIDIYNIPGYGKSIDGSVPALNLFLKYKIAF